MASQRGSLLLWSLSLSVLMVLSVVGSYPFFRSALRATSFSFWEAQAVYLAEAGIEEGMWYLQPPPSGGATRLGQLAIDNYFQNAPWTTPGAARADLTGDDMIRIDDVLAATQNPWFGWLDVSAGSCTANPLHPTACQRTFSNYAGSDGVPIGDVTVTVTAIQTPQPVITAKASVPSLQNVQAQRTIRAVLKQEVFRYAAFGRNRLILGDHVQMDSYDSGQGIYGGTNISQNALIGTNGSGSSPEVDIQNTDILVQGKLLVSSGTTVLTPGGTPITNYVPGGQITQADQMLPRVQIPSALTGLTVTTTPTASWTGFSAYSGNGDFSCSGTCTCSAAVRIKSLYVLGTLYMQTGCQILIDKLDSTLPYKPGGGILDTDGTGTLRKSGTDTTQLFLRDGYFSIDGGGLTSSVASPAPPTFQVFVTCTTPPCNNVTASGLAQRQPFYGVIYVEDGNLSLQRASENGTSYNATYQGAFVAGRTLNVNTLATSKTVYLHYDEQASSVALDGSGSTTPPTYKILSWEIQ